MCLYISLWLLRIAEISWFPFAPLVWCVKYISGIWQYFSSGNIEDFSNKTINLAIFANFWRQSRFQVKGFYFALLLSKADNGGSVTRGKVSFLYQYYSLSCLHEIKCLIFVKICIHFTFGFCTKFIFVGNDELNKRPLLLQNRTCSCKHSMEQKNSA